VCIEAGKRRTWMRMRCVGGVALALCVGFVFWASGIQFPVTVTDIAVDGVVEIRERDVLEVVGFDVGDEVVESDVKAASQAIFDLGWFTEVVPEIEGEGTIVFRVSENPVVQTIEIKGNVNKSSVSLFGIKLFEVPIMSTTRIRQILLTNDVRRRAVLNRVALEDGLTEVIEAYNDRGYLLVMVGDVKAEETLSIEIIEARVEGNRIEGLDTVPLSEAEEMIDVPLGEPLVRRDLQRVLQRLGRSVYFADVEVIPEQGSQPDSVVLLWTLSERALIDSPVEVREIVLGGVTSLPAETASSSLGPIPTGSIDNYELLQVLEDLYDLYYDAGYVMVRFSVAQIGDEVLHLEVEEGEIGEIVLSGNTRTKDYVIQRNLELRTGRVLTRNELRVAYQRLNALGYFDSVDVLPEWTDSGIRLTVSVTERERLGGLNGTLALEPCTGALIGELSVEQKNLFGTGQDVSISFSRGLTDEEEPSTSTWTLEYSTVAYFSEFDRVSLDLYRRLSDVVEDDEAATYETLGGSVAFEYPIANYTSLRLRFRHEDERRSGSLQWTPIDSVSSSLVYNDTDDPYFPTQGNVRTAEVEKAGGFAAGKEYTKLGVTWIQYESLSFALFGELEQAFAVRLKAGWGDDALPVTQAYDLGGPACVRGTTGVPVQRVFVANFEYRLQLTEGLVITSFLDAGVNLDSVRVSDAMASVGLELGINAAGVFVRLDFAWALGPEMRWYPQFDLGLGPMF
jgi:outer membrane protein insertion porin family